MRKNLPVTDVEYPLPDSVTLMSTTDLESRITYANDAFVAASGFSRAELEGQPHNIVRHPDMPREAFADMWATLRAGEPWSALVKNRRKNGDFYWVRAHTMPVVRNGRPVGYMSVRTKPLAGEVAQAERLYRPFIQGANKDWRFHKGRVLRSSFWSPAKLNHSLGLRARTRLVLLGVWAVLTCVTWLVCGASVEFLELVLPAALAFWGAGWMLETQIAAPVEQLQRMAIGIASGAARQTMGVVRTDEIGMAARCINQMGMMFRWLVDDVSNQVRHVQLAISDIAQGNNDLSERTERAAQSVQATVGALASVAQAIHANSETALTANQLAIVSRDAAEQGQASMSEVMQTMGTISDRSQRIEQIVNVIDGIAFQSNILALNAAVEAARAGSQGRGFAVVAGEVRDLSRRSSEAAKEIKQLIEASVEGVSAGERIVGSAQQAVADIVQQVHHASHLMSEITQAASLQSVGVDQVSLSIQQLDDVTQQNAALVEQSAAASSSLRAQVEQLVRAVNVFH